MKLSDARLIFLDLQTTGMRPPAAQAIEIGWCVSGSETATSQLFRLPEERELPRMVAEITGLTAEVLRPMPDPHEWTNGFQTQVGEVHAAVIHYAQFETPFLDHYQVKWPAVLCTQKLVSRLYPTLPSRNLRAVAGYFGYPILGPNRAGPFAQATYAIWQGLKPKLLELGLERLTDVIEWSKQKPPAKKREITYRIPARLRLDLPDQPGIYRMKAKNGAVLYVGKATSLKDRVNSYFRGIKNRDRRKLEMLAQVWDLEVEICASPLEAALTECDEIKRLDPPYNVALKKNERDVVFYSRDFASCGPESASRRRGPFRPGGIVEMMLSLWRSLESGEFENIFYLPIDPAVLKEGFGLFAREQRLNQEDLKTARSLFALALRLYRRLGEPEAKSAAAENEDEDQTETAETPESVAGKFERLFRRTGAALAFARKIQSARNWQLEYQFNGEWRRLEFQHGRRKSSCPVETAENILSVPAWDIETYDRLSVLLSELSRVPFRILRHSPKASDSNP